MHRKVSAHCSSETRILSLFLACCVTICVGSLFCYTHIRETYALRLTASQDSLSIYRNSTRSMTNLITDKEFDASITDKMDSFVMPVSEYVRYLKMRQDYDGRLAAVPRLKYMTPEKFIKYGKSVNKKLLGNATNVKKILVWTSLFGNWSWVPKAINCAREVTCESSTDRSHLPYSDAVIMHARDLRGLQSLPEQRYPHQGWLYFLQECPYHTGLNLAKFNGVFNWTGTYRRDSDVVAPYVNRFQKRGVNLTEESYKQLVKNILAPKVRHNLAFLVSNCATPHTKRLSYVKELMKHIPVDIYGRCGNLTCLPRSSVCTATMKQYKFHLAMENSNCRDYITEKVVEPLLKWKSVPVVMGGADPGDYEKLGLPPSSYIHISGFRTPKELADYLLLLDKYPALYEKYHKWRMTHHRPKPETFWCKLCRMLHKPSLLAQTYEDFVGWYNEDTCKTFHTSFNVP